MLYHQGVRGNRESGSGAQHATGDKLLMYVVKVIVAREQLCRQSIVVGIRY